MTKFRPCIDLHAGHVKQIVGGTLTDGANHDLKTNFISEKPAGHYAALYKEHGLTGSHVIMLGPGNEQAALEAVKAWPNGLQVGGGITAENAMKWIENGAEKVIITSYLFPDAQFSQSRLQQTLKALNGDRSRLVIDLSCRAKDGKWFVAMNKWQTITDFEVDECMRNSLKALHWSSIAKHSVANIMMLEGFCSEFLIHAADVEGLQGGIDERLVKELAKWCSIPVTYAGGAKHLQDFDLVDRLSNSKVDLTIGSALDIFGGSLVKFEDCVKWNKSHVT